MIKIFRSVFFIYIALIPVWAQAQFSDQFIIEAQIYEETVPGATSSSAGGSSGTRVERNENGEVSVVPNVRDIAITAQGDTIHISWTNPAVDFTSIRVVQGNFYAKDPYDGWVVYEGVGDSFSIESPGENGAFYTFFVLMNNENYSSGVATFYADASELVTPFPPVWTDDTDTATESNESSNESSGVNDVWESFILLGIQNDGLPTTITAHDINAFSSAEDIVIFVPLSSVPTGTRSVVVAILNLQTNSYERFLLRREENGFSANIPRRLHAGEYELFVGLFDFSSKLRTQKTYTIDLYPHYFIEAENHNDKDGVVLVDDYIYIVYLFFALVLFIFLLRLWVVIKR